MHDVQQRLRNDIVSGALPFGSRLIIEDLATRYGVSHMPIREALRVLHGEGLVVIEPNRGAHVRPIYAGFIEDVFDVMRETPQHTYQVLTKRAHRLARIADKLDWPDNLWMGVSVESADVVDRIDYLRSVPATTRFLSCEPLLTALPSLDLAGIDWVIAGGESGPKARPMDPNWVEEIRDQCISAEVAFFFKQWGGRTPKANGRELGGRTWDDMPRITRFSA